VNYAIVDSDRRRPDELNIQALAVLANHRNQGIGSRLLQAVEELALADGYRSLSLEVIDSNRRAQGLYERYGFKTDRTTKTWPYTHRAGFREYDYMVKHLESKAGSPLAGPHTAQTRRTEKQQRKR
jgi:ribosomal protein S18 acetylase RimI-like enzyme